MQVQGCNSRAAKLLSVTWEALARFPHGLQHKQSQIATKPVNGQKSKVRAVVFPLAVLWPSPGLATSGARQCWLQDAWLTPGPAATSTCCRWSTACACATTPTPRSGSPTMVCAQGCSCGAAALKQSFSMPSALCFDISAVTAAKSPATASSAGLTHNISARAIVLSSDCEDGDQAVCCGCHARVLRHEKAQHLHVRCCGVEF